MMRTLWTVFLRDFYLACTSQGATLSIISFFVICGSLFAFGIGSDSNLLAPISHGAIWVCALLASMLALPQLFENDATDGTLIQLVLAPVPLQFILIGKYLSHWLSTGLPLVVISPIVALMLHFPGNIIYLMISLCLGTLLLTLIGAIGASLALSARKNATLTSIITLPLTIPTLIFGANAAATNDNFIQPVSLLLGLILFFAPISIFASSLAVKYAVAHARR